MQVLDLQAKREHLFAELRNIETAGGKSGESADAEPPKTCAICSWPVESNDFFKCKAEHVFCASCMEHAIVNALDFDNAELLPTFICGDAICAMGCGNVVAVKGSAAKESGVLANMIVDRAKGVVTNALKQQRGGGRLDDAVAKARRQAEDIHMGACPGGCGTSMLLGDFEGCLARTCEAQHCLVNFCFACEQVTMCDRHTAQLQSEQEKVDSKQISAIDLYKGVVCVLCRVANHNHCRQCVPGTDSYYLARDMVQGHFLKVKADRAAHIVTSLLSTREEKNAFMQALDSEVRKVVRAKHPMVF